MQSIKKMLNYYPQLPLRYCMTRRCTLYQLCESVGPLAGSESAHESHGIT